MLFDKLRLVVEMFDPYSDVLRFQQRQNKTQMVLQSYHNRDTCSDTLLLFGNENSLQRSTKPSTSDSLHLLPHVSSYNQLEVLK